MIAHIWNVKVEDLKVNVEFPTTSIIGKATKKNIANIFEKRTDRSIRVYIECNGNGIAFSKPLDLKSIQKNGETLLDCLDVEVKDRKDGNFETNFVCKNYNNLVFSFSVDSELIQMVK